MLFYFINFLITYFIYFISSCLFHSLHLILFEKKTIDKLKLFIYILSPSYFFAKNSKKNKTAEEITSLIKFWNLGNFIISFSFFISLCFLSIKKDVHLLLFLSMFWIIRCVSRSLEIIIAFFKDITTEGSRSNLIKYDRIKLATISYLEVILNFGILYFLLYNLELNLNSLFYILNIDDIPLNLRAFILDTKNLYPNIKLIFSDLKLLTPNRNNVFYFILASFFTSTGTKVVGINPFFMLQLSTSLSLLVFGIAGYISDVKNK